MDWDQWVKDVHAADTRKVRRNNGLLHWLVQHDAPLNAWTAFLKHSPPLGRLHPSNRHTALYLAILYGRDVSWRVLLPLERNVNRMSGTDGETVMHAAARVNNAECIQMLVARGANVDVQDEIGFTPLHTAARYNALQAAKVLVDADACRACTLPTKYAPVHIAAMFDAVHVFTLLRDPAIEASGKHTPLFIAQEAESRRVLDVLLADSMVHAG